MSKSLGRIRTVLIVFSLLLPVFADAQERSGTASGISAEAARVQEFSRNSAAFDIDFSPNGALLASAADGLIRLWAIPAGTQVRVLRAHTDTTDVIAIAWSPDGRMLASVSTDRRIRLWNPTTGALVRTVAGLGVNMGSLAFSPDGRLLASGDADNIIRLWNVATGTVVRSIRGHSDRVWALAFSPNGEFLASSSYDEIQIWRVSDGALVGKIDDNDRTDGLSLSPDGMLVAKTPGNPSGEPSPDARVSVEEVVSGRNSRWLEGRFRLVYSPIFSPNGLQLAALTVQRKVDDSGESALQAEEDGDPLVRRQAGATANDPDFFLMVHIWDVATGSILRTYDTGHQMMVARYSPDGQWLAVGGYSGIQLWIADGFDDDLLAEHPEIAKQLAPRDEFETSAEFQARLALGRQAYQDTLRAIQRAAALALAQRIAQSREEVILPAFSEGGLVLGRYDADRGVYPITIDGRDTTITMSRDDAREFSQKRADVKMEAVRQLAPDGCTRLLLDRVLIHPTTGQRYALGSQSLEDARCGQPEGRADTGSPSAGDASGVVGGTGPVNVDQPYFDFQVEKPVAPMPGSSGPAYPDVLRSGGVEGQVLAQFVVDTTGRVEIDSFRVLRSDHAMFDQAVRSALPRLRFLPAEINGRKVRQLVQQPFVFALQR